MLLQLIMTVKGMNGRLLIRCRGRDIEILRQSFHSASHLLRHHHPANAPACHGKIFRHAVHDKRILGEMQRRLSAPLIRQTMINLIRNQPHLIGTAKGADFT